MSTARAEFKDAAGRYVEDAGQRDFLRAALRAYDETVAGLTGAQYLCIAMVVGGLLLGVGLRRRADRSTGPGGV